MFVVNVRRVHAQRAVHKNRDARKFPGADQFVQHIDNLLRAPDRKRGDDDFAFLLERFAYELADQFVRVRALLVEARGVGGFNLEIIHVLDRNRVAQQFIAAAPDVAGEQPAEFFAVFLNVQNDLRRTEDVSGVAERDGHAGHGFERLFVIVGDELRHAFLGVGRGVKRLDGRLMFFGAHFGNEKRVLFLNVRGVEQHDAAQIARGRSAMDRAVVSFAQARQFAGVVQMRMAQDDGVHRARVERQNFIELLRLLAMALEQAAFEQQFFAVDLQQIHRAGGGARRAEEMDFHARPFNHGPPCRSKTRSHGGRWINHQTFPGGQRL